jgi:hypothetical protein
MQEVSILNRYPEPFIPWEHSEQDEEAPETEPVEDELPEQVKELQERITRLYDEHTTINAALDELVKIFSGSVFLPAGAMTRLDIARATGYDELTADEFVVLESAVLAFVHHQLEYVLGPFMRSQLDIFREEYGSKVENLPD